MQYIYSQDDEPIVSLDQQTEIVDWVRKNYNSFKLNGYNRYFQQLDFFNINTIPSCIWKIKQAIIDKEKLHDYQPEPFFRDSVGYMLDGGQLHLHSDQNPPNSDLIHVRYNVYVQLPIKGGYPIYKNIHCTLKERTYICCRSGIDKHYCAKVEGPRERIILSFGFLIPKKRVENIIYNYDS
jgi:hypothetical protein